MIYLLYFLFDEGLLVYDYIKKKDDENIIIYNTIKIILNFLFLGGII